MDKQEITKLLIYCDQAIKQNREKWMHRTTGPHWANLRRFVNLYDLVNEMQAERDVIIDSAAEEIAAQKQKSAELSSALRSMVEQYLVYLYDDEKGIAIYTTDCMSAGEEAIDLLVRLGVMRSYENNTYVFTEARND